MTAHEERFSLEKKDWNWNESTSIRVEELVVSWDRIWAVAEGLQAEVESSESRCDHG